ncbi:ABC transporter permease subunit [Stieleria sp. JC731]|uniref:ABC transporter permease subunit/CPBP intramembrane protease n=1 Tax=Pirellulaceae TaxID=2691357 RepID=UPI001E3A95F1|nr:ABC transporter permease subunit/CPBP intramembrane protease [Stieleria sp. JC731]MCC9601293.1 ABC transporter permease subunit [Stieleria sp. JC731]
MAPESSQPSRERSTTQRRHFSTGRRLARLCQKELRETLRDRRTIVTLLMMPLLVYPLLSMALNRFLLNAARDAEQVPYAIGVATDEEGSALLAWLESPSSQPPDAIIEASRGRIAKFKVVNTTNDSPPVEALKSGKVDIAVSINDGTPPVIEVKALRGNTVSESAARIVTERIHWLRLSYAEATASQVTHYVPPPSIILEDVGNASSPSMLGTIVPLVLVLMTITGAVYPAIDLTAGERERGTMESLMASPVPRTYILFSKYVAVVTVALLTAIANLLAMFTTLWAGRLLPLLTGDDSGFPWLAVLQILLLLVLFSAFFSAVLLSLTSFARSFKEAQAYLIPIMLLSLTPGMLSLLPGVTLSGPLAIAPLINIVLLAREVLQGTAEAAPALVTVLSTLGYAAAAVAVASMCFGNDAVSRTSGQTFASMLHRPKKTSQTPSPHTAAMTLALLVPAYYVVSNLLMGIVPGMNLYFVLILSAVTLILVFGLIPFLAARITKSELKTTYQLGAPNATSLFGAFLMGLGAWIFAHELYVLAQQVGIGVLDEERIAETQKTVENFKLAPAWLLLSCLALTPAVIEEFCFRGFLFTSLRKIFSPWKLIATTAVLFGLFHVITGNTLLVERFLPTTLLGIILGWLAYRTGSVWPGVLMHFTHNALLELVAKYQDRLTFLGGDAADQVHLPVTWLAGLTVITLLGVGIVFWGTKKSTRTETPPPEQDSARQPAI